MLLLLLACSASQDLAINAAEASFDCGYVTSDVRWDDDATLGISPAQLLAPHLGQLEAAGRWADGTEILVHAEIAPSGSLPVWSAAEGGDGEICGDQLLIPITAVLVTSDGAFDERFELDWVVLPDDAREPTILPFGGEREEETSGGTFDTEDVNTAPGEEVQWLTVAASHGPDGLHGRVEATIFDEDVPEDAAPLLTW